MEKRVNIQEFVPTDLLKIPTILQQLIWMIMSITTDNEPLMLTLPFLATSQIIGKRMVVGHQESAIIDCLYRPPKLLIVFSQ